MIISAPTISELVSQFSTISFSLQKIAASLQNQSFWSTQLFAAVIGALLGLMPSFYFLWKDRPIIKVGVKHSLVPYPSSGKVMNGLSITISNSGRRQITIEDVFLKFKDGEIMIFPNKSLFVGNRDLPKTLYESTSHSVTILAGNLVPEIRNKKDYPISACYRSATGKIYKCKISQKFWDTLFTVNNSD